MNNLFIKETYVNESNNYIIGESEWYETFTDNKSVLYKSLLKEFGKPQKMFKDTKEGKMIQVGWIFTKNKRYDDTNEIYKQSTWVSVSKTEPVNECKTLNITYPF